MAFGWFSKKGADGGKALQKARKLFEQGRWAEALTYFEEARDAEADREEATRGARSCREQLVAWNLEEASAYADSGDPERAQEHARLARELAGDEADLLRQSQEALEGFVAEPAAERPAPERRFAPTCSCAAPCETEDLPPEGDEEAPEELFEFYMESLSPAEREVLEPLGETFRGGFVLLQQGDLERARPLLESAAAESPEKAGTHYTLGLLAALSHDTPAAVSRFTRALEVAPDFAPAAHHWADLLREAERVEEALGVLGPWVETHAEDAEAILLQAQCFLEADDAPQALETVRAAAARVTAEDPRPALLEARVLRRLGRSDEALLQLQSVAARRPDLLDALVPLGQILLEQGGTSAERAAEVFKQCYRRDPERGWWYLLRVAQAYAARGWKDQAREMLQAARQELPEEDAAVAEWTAASRLLAGS